MDFLDNLTEAECYMKDLNASIPLLEQIHRFFLLVFFNVQRYQRRIVAHILVPLLSTNQDENTNGVLVKGIDPIFDEMDHHNPCWFMKEFNTSI